DGTQKTREERIKDLNIKNKEDEEKLLKKYIDLRLFGATIALKGEVEGARGSSITWTGPVQFRFGRSLHKVEPKTIKGTSVMPSKKQVTRGTFIETQILPYSLISFYGVINENAAKTTRLTEKDVEDLIDGIWNGTKNLITRSKFGQMPRFLLRVIYNEENYHIGDLDKKIKLISDKDDKEIRDIFDVKLDITELVKTLEREKDKIKTVQLEVNNDVTFLIDDAEVKGEDLLDKLSGEISVEKLNLEN
ncbi:type I-B CRISPR-associated protein Cas7/Csh2, partial [Thermococci archaeon]